MTTGFQYFDSWALVVSLRRRKWPHKETSLGAQLQECSLMVLSRAEGMERREKSTRAVFVILGLATVPLTPIRQKCLHDYIP